MIRRVLTAAVVALLVTACGGGSGGSAAGDVAVATISDMLGGRAGGVWDRGHPEMQARVSKAGYIACATDRGGAAVTGAKITAVEHLAAAYTTAAGASVPAEAVTVRASAGRETVTTQVWLVDVGGVWRVVDVVSPGKTPPEGPCMARL